MRLTMAERKTQLPFRSPTPQNLRIAFAPTSRRSAGRQLRIEANRNDR
jgi:hypothetical protein